NVEPDGARTADVKTVSAIKSVGRRRIGGRRRQTRTRQLRHDVVRGAAVLEQPQRRGEVCSSGFQHDREKDIEGSEPQAVLAEFSARRLIESIDFVGDSL